MTVSVPPLKSQGIKTKLVPWITSIVPHAFEGVWIEPFMGTGVVAFNLAPSRALLCDTNPHLVGFYQAIADGRITPERVRQYLNQEGAKLLDKGPSHFYAVRERFNKAYSPLDFLFLNRAGFNGIIRFNRKGKLNTPFCRKPRRFAQAYVTKIVNQVSHVSQLCKAKQFVFQCQPFEDTIVQGTPDDVIYCDPPYIDRHVDYYHGWNQEHEKQLYGALVQTQSSFILSTWHHNHYRENESMKSFWSHFHILTRRHFYHVGGHEKNRNPMVEALVTNYDPSMSMSHEEEKPEQ